MAFNGDGPHNKRQRTDNEQGNHRAHDGVVTGNNGSSSVLTGPVPQSGGGPGTQQGAIEPRRKRQDDNKPNHVLLFTIINPMYPITVEVLHTICQSSGQVLRIVIFKKNGVQAMVEFDSIESATRAKDTLNGADIYSGCCTLKIDFAKPEKLNVHKNDADSWDYTVSMVKDGNTNGRPQPLLQEPHLGCRPQPYTGYPTEPRYDEYPPSGGHTYPGDPYSGASGDNSYVATRAGGPPGGAVKGQCPPCPPGQAPSDYRGDRGGNVAASLSAQPPAYMPPAPHQQGAAVMMIYGLDPLTTNTDKLFNLMCLYGNVARIKFLKTKEGTAMVQMGDSIAVERCVQNLNNVIVAATGACPKITPSSKCLTNAQSNENAIGQSEHKLQLAYSKQPYLSEVTNPYPLPDKSPSYKEYITNKNNRFMNPAMASKNRIQPPSKILHFFNTPPAVTEEELVQVFKDYDVAPPKAVKLFPMKSERSSSGLLEFGTTAEAVAAVMACNHAAIESPGTKFPFIMKLCFSSSRNMSIRTSNNFDNGNAQNIQQNNGNELKMDQDQ